MADDLSTAIVASANRLKVNPLDLATAISYETAGTFDPWKRGPTTQWGQHRGLIQWGEPQRQKYGVFQGMSNADQMSATERYLTDAGVKPGMGLMDIYSAINAGHVGRNNASDANNGGAPGTVADKVNNQMASHRAKAQQLLGGQFMQPQQQQVAAAPPASNLASMFGAPQPVSADPLAADPTQTLGGGSPLAGIAMMFGQQQQKRKEEREAEAQAEATRRAALFAPQGMPGLYG